MNDFDIVSFAHIIAGITFVFTFHMFVFLFSGVYILETSRVLSWSHFCLLKLQHLSAYMIVFHFHMLGKFLPIHTCWLHTVVTLPSSLVCNDFGTLIPVVFTDFFPYFRGLFEGHLSTYACLHLCSLFTLIFLKQTTFLRYVMLQLFCSYHSWRICSCSPCYILGTFTTVLSEIRALCPSWLFYIVLWCRGSRCVFQIFSDGSIYPCYD
jgi:hypothetical protein